MTGELSAGDPVGPSCELIEVSVSELRQLFNAMDPAPFRKRDLDPVAEEFIVSWARELPRDAPLGLLVHLHAPAGSPNEAVVLREALQQFFSERASISRRKLKQLFRRGRISLLIGLAFLCATIGASELIERWLNPSGFMKVLRESLSIGGWVAMWRPIEVFLYDWWPIRAEVRLYDRLAAMSVRIRYATDENPDARQSDWPVTSRSEEGCRLPIGK